MPIRIYIEDSPNSFLIEDNDDLSLGQIKEKVANELHLGIEDLESVMIDVSSSKKNINIVGPVENLKLRQDYGVNGSPRISVRVTPKHALTDKNQVLMKQAQSGLTTAITEAQKAKAHVIITIGSCLHTLHDNDSLKRQQFPIEQLGLDEGPKLVHFIHIDPGFEKSIPNVEQLYEKENWKLSINEGPVRKYTHSSENYTMTTIAAPILNEEECKAYFNNANPVHTILGVNLLKYELDAAKMGIGFVTGNFYAAENKPVINIPPKVNDLDPNIHSNISS